MKVLQIDPEGFFVFQVETEQWVRQEPEGWQEIGVGCAQVSGFGFTYVLGGFNQESSNKVWRFDGLNLEKQTPMLQARTEFACLLNGDYLYAIGGYNVESQQVIANCEMLDIQTQKWHPLPQLKRGRKGGVCTLLGNNIYVLGGDGMQTIEILADTQWLILELSFPACLSGFGLYPIIHETYMIFGGRDANGELTDEIMLLNFNNDSIVNIGHLEKPMRINKPYLVYQNNLYLFQDKEFIKYNLDQITEPYSQYQLKDYSLSPITQQAQQPIPQQLRKYNINFKATSYMLLVKSQDSTDDETDHFVQLASYLIQNGQKVVIEPQFTHLITEECITLSENYRKLINLIITIGGDNAVFNAIAIYKSSQIPSLLTFYVHKQESHTNYQIESYFEVFSQIISGQPIQIEPKKRFNCTMIDQEFTKEWGMASSEICIDRRVGSSMVDLDLYINGNYSTKVTGDGLLVSTPGGSTGYQLQAGGSITHYRVPAMLITPICPHSLSFRPILLPDNIILALKVPEQARDIAWVQLDKHTKFKLNKGASIEIRVSDFHVPYVTPTNSMEVWLNGLKSAYKWS